MNRDKRRLLEDAQASIISSYYLMLSILDEEERRLDAYGPDMKTGQVYKTKRANLQWLIKTIHSVKMSNAHLLKFLEDKVVDLR